MEANNQSGPTLWQSLPPYGKALIVGAGVLAAGGAGFFLWRSLTKDPYVPYPEQPDGAVRLFCEELLEERDAAVQGQWPEATLWKCVSKANKEDDYEKYMDCLQDLAIFYTITNKPDKALNCVNRRLKSKDLEADYPILNDYLKCLCNKADQCERVGKSMLASRVAEKGVRIEALFLGKPREGESNISKDWLKYSAPRALYLSLLEVLKASKPQPTKEDAQQAIDQMQHLFDYAENHLPADYKQRSLDELQHLANISGTMAALYLTAEQPNKSLIWLKKAEAFLGTMQELPSIILQRTLLLRHLAECYLQLNDLDNASVHMQNCVDGLIQILGDTKEEEPVTLLIDCTGLLINLLAAQQGNPQALAKCSYYQELIRTKYPEQLEKMMRQEELPAEGQ